MELLILSIALGFLYLFIKSNKPTQKHKSKIQKQAEILENYKQKMNNDLVEYDGNKALFLEKKTELLKVFAQELSMNMFFDKDETRELIRELASHEVTSAK